MMGRLFLNRSSLLLMLAVLAGLCAAWAARQAIQGRILQIESEAHVRTVSRVVAAHDLRSGTALHPDHLAVRDYPASLAPSDSLPPERHAELAGAILATDLYAGDLILPSHTARARRESFSSKLGPGRRAITMPVDAINSVSGLLETGDLVDLYVSFEYQKRRITAPLLQGVLVLATGSDHSDDPASGRSGPYSTVTLDMAPEDAIKLVAARESGTITALLRHPRDNLPDQKAVRGNLASLLGVQAEPPNPDAAKAPVIYGDRAIRRLPALRPASPGSNHASGVFNLPYMPELVSRFAAPDGGLEYFYGEAGEVN